MANKHTIWGLILSIQSSANKNATTKCAKIKYCSSHNSRQHLTTIRTLDLMRLRHQPKDGQRQRTTQTGNIFREKQDIRFSSTKANSKHGCASFPMVAVLFNDNLRFIYFNTVRTFELTSYTTLF